VHIRFHLLAKSTTVNIFSDIGTKAWPPEVMFDKLLYLEPARVACHGVVMEPAEKIMMCSCHNSTSE